MSASSSVTGLPAPITATQAGATDPDGNLQPLLVDADGALEVSGTITASNPSVAPTPGLVPADATYIGGNSAGNLVGIKVDSGGAVQVDIESVSGNVTVVQPTGTNLHAVIDSGTVAATQSGTWNITNVSGTVSLPTGAATETTLSTLNGKITACNTGAVVVSSSALPSGAATAALQTQPGVDIGDVTVNNAAGASAVNIQDGGNSITVDGTVATTQSGTWTVQPGNTANTTAWLVKELTSSSSSVTNVASSASSVSLLASTSGRLYASFFNDSTAVLYLKFGTTASTTSYTVQLGAGGYYEMSAARIYTGAIDGIWASANGNVRITELS